MGNLTVKESGEMVNFISPNVSKITSFKVHFSPKQEGSGDPSPENVREITGWNGVEVNTTQRNIYANTKNIYRKIFIPSGTTWTASCDGGGYVYVYDTNQKYIDSWALSGTDETSGRRYKTVTISSYDIYYVRINGNKCQNPQFEFGALSEYEPVVENSITFPSDIRTVYGGYVDLISGELVQTWKTVNSEDLTWSVVANSTRICAYGDKDFKVPEYVSIAGELIGEQMYVVPQTTILTNYPNGVCIMSSGYLYKYFDGTNYPQGKISYKLATPITHQLTPQQLSTLKGQNNFWSNADYVEIEYEFTETFDIQKAKRKIILNQPHVESASGDLVTFDTDMKGKLKECKVYFSPVQEGEGDPSPDNVREIKGWNGVNIYKAGQNLIPNDIPAQFYRVYPTASQGAFVESGTAFSTFIIPVPKGKICLARTTRSLLPYGALCDELPTVGANAFDGITMTNRNSHVFDNSEGHKYFAITVNRSVEINSDWESFLNTEPRLTISDAVQPYTAPTDISTHSIDWTNSAGTIYGGYMDLVSGELVQTWYGFTLDGVNNYLNSTPQLLNNGLATIYDYIGSGGLNNLPKGPVNAYTGAIICNKFPLAYSRENEGIATGSGSLYVRLLLDSSKLEDVSSTSAIKESMIKWQQENPLQIVYKLRDPIHYQLTPQQILTLKGINNVYSNTNGQTEIKYWKH